MLIIQAMNVHQGGGLSLLVPLLDSAAAHGPAIALLDERLKDARVWPQNLQARWVKPTIKARFKAEVWLRRRAAPDDVVLCFGNLPPLWRLPCRVVVFVQNRLLIDSTALDIFGWKTRLRLQVERKWLARTADHADSLVVQTPSMQRLACEALGFPRAKVSICAFTAIAPGGGTPAPGALPSTARSPKAEFLYPASGDPYKNHRVLVSAWALLAAQGLRPTLHLTIDRALYPELAGWIETARLQGGLSIVNHGYLSAHELGALYGAATALVYPSLLESFGLPLLEAQAAGLPVIAAELDYVRDVVVPEQSFDPHSAVSLARAVQRFLQQPAATAELVTATEFMKIVQPGR